MTEDSKFKFARIVSFLCAGQALSASVTEDELSADNTAVALVGEGTAFTILEGDALKPYLAALKADDDAPPPGAPQLPPYIAYCCTLFLPIGKVSCRQAAVKGCHNPPLVGLAGSKQDPINRGHIARNLYRPPPAGANCIICVRA